MNIEEFVHNRKNRTRVYFSHVHQVQAVPEKIFPLLCPTREYEWIESWNCDLIYAKSGYAEEYGVFTTNFPQDGGVDLWVVSRYEPASHIQFVRSSSLRTMIYDIALVDNGDGSTTLTWQQIITGLNDAGDEFVSNLKERDFTDLISVLGKLLNYYLEVDDMLKLEELHDLA